MKLESRLRLSLSKRTGNVVLRQEWAGLGSPSHLTNAIKALIDAGCLVRLGHGIYAKAHPDAQGEARPAATPEVLIQELSEKRGMKAHGAQATCRTSRLDRRKASRGGKFLVPMEIDQLPTRDVRNYVERLAKAHGVEYRRTGLDDFAEAVTRVAGDDVKLNRTEKLLVALKKKKVINGRQLARLVTNCMREEKIAESVRSVRGFPDRGLSAQR